MSDIGAVLNYEDPKQLYDLTFTYKNRPQKYWEMVLRRGIAIEGTPEQVIFWLRKMTKMAEDLRRKAEEELATCRREAEAVLRLGRPQ